MWALWCRRFGAQSNLLHSHHLVEPRLGHLARYRPCNLCESQSPRSCYSRWVLLTWYQFCSWKMFVFQATRQYIHTNWRFMKPASFDIALDIALAPLCGNCLLAACESYWNRALMVLTQANVSNIVNYRGAWNDDGDGIALTLSSSVSFELG